jgi:hypothetical protein
MNKLQKYRKIVESSDHRLWKGDKKMWDGSAWTHYVILVGGNGKAPKVDYKLPGNYVVMCASEVDWRNLPVLDRRFPSSLVVRFMDE